MNQKTLRKSYGAAFILLMCVVFLSSCASMSQNRQRHGAGWQDSASDTFDAGVGAIFNGEKGAFWGLLVGATAGGLTIEQIKPYMDAQQSDFVRVLTGSQTATLKRNGEIITITLQGKTYSDVKYYKVVPRLYSELDRIAAVLKSYPKTWIQVGGYADPRGSKADNLELSQTRADIVANELAKRGVNISRIQSIGFGDTKTLSGGDSTKYALDRRVELQLKPMKQTK